MPSRPGVSQLSFGKLEDELISVAKRLSNRQLLELADDFHAMLRERRSLRHGSPPAEPYKGLNDNKRLTGRR
jgi:hypothetical protein